MIEWKFRTRSGIELDPSKNRVARPSRQGGRVAFATRSRAMRLQILIKVPGRYDRQRNHVTFCMYTAQLLVAGTTRPDHRFLRRCPSHAAGPPDETLAGRTSF